MPVEVVPYDPIHLSELTDLYNDLTRSVPHCYPIQPEELAAAFAGACGYESHGETMTQEAVFVAVDPAVVGFVHVGEGERPSKLGSPSPQGCIRFLAYPRGRRDAGQALLDRAEAWMRDAGLDSILVYRQAYRYPFYHFSHAYFSDHMEHVLSLLYVNEYNVCDGEVFLDWPHMDPGSPRNNSGLDIDLEVKQTAEQGRLPDITLEAFVGGEKIGVCESISARAFSAQDEVEEWIFTQWLGVEEPYQGKGVGRYLLSCALNEARSAGYRHAAISTATDNYRALLFYSNFGYHAVDWTRQLIK